MNRRQARTEAFKILFQLALNEQEPVLTKEQAGNDYICEIVAGVRKNQSAIDQVIGKELINWTFDRIATVEKTILRMAVYEMDHMNSIPSAVSINEAVELAHVYGDENSGKFINGVLSKINR